MKIIVCDPISPKGIALLQQRPEFQVVVLPKRLPEAELLPLVVDAVALVVRSETKVTAKVIEAAKQLRVVGRAGVGVDNVDIEAATQHGTVVMNTPGGNTVTTAELAFTMILSLARKVPQAHATIVGGKWDRKLFQGVELAGKTLGVLGMGRIGTEVAKRAIAFGMRVVAYDPYLTEDRAKTIGAEFAESLDAVYRAADFITVHMPVTKETREMLNAGAFAKMKAGVKIVNCARGEIIAENDLIAALASGKVAGAALDLLVRAAGARSKRQADLDQQVPRTHRRRVRTDVKLLHRDRALAICAADHRLCLDRGADGRKVLRSVGLAERAADRAAVAHHRVGNHLLGVAKQREVLSEELRVQQLDVAGERSDRDLLALLADVGELGQIVDVDQVLGLCESQFHHRHQAVAAGDDARPGAALLERRDDAVDAGRALVLK